MLKTKQKETGFSLVEVIVTIGIFSMLTVVVTAMVVSVLAANVNIRGDSIALDNVNVVMESLVRDIRSGSTFHCGDERLGTIPYDIPVDCLSAGDNIRFAYEKSGGNPGDKNDQIVYFADQTTGGRYEIYKSTNGGANFFSVFGNEDVSFDTVEFNVIGSGDGVSVDGYGDQVAKVRIVLAGEIFPGTNSARTFSYQTTVSERFSPVVERTYNANLTNYTPATNQPPTVTFTFPTNGAVIEGGPTTDLHARASDPDATLNDSGLGEVVFYMKDQDDPTLPLIEIDTVGGDGPNFNTSNWNTLDLDDSRPVTLVARAVDSFGAMSTDAEIAIRFNNPLDAKPVYIYQIREPLSNAVYPDLTPFDLRVAVRDDNVRSLKEKVFKIGRPGSSGVGSGYSGVGFTPVLYDDATFDAKADGTDEIEYVITGMNTGGNRIDSCLYTDWVENSGIWTCEREFYAYVKDQGDNEDDEKIVFKIQDTTPPEFSSMTFSENINDIEDGDEVDISIRVSDPYGGTGVDTNLKGTNPKNIFRYQRCSLDGSDCGNVEIVRWQSTESISGGYELEDFEFEYRDGSKCADYYWGICFWWEPRYRPVYTFWAVDQDRAGNSKTSNKWQVTVQQGN